MPKKAPGHPASAGEIVVRVVRANSTIAGPAPPRRLPWRGMLPPNGALLSPRPCPRFGCEQGKAAAAVEKRCYEPAEASEVDETRCSAAKVERARGVAQFCRACCERPAHFEGDR